MIPVDVQPNLIQQVYDRILSAIVDHSLAPGLRIRQHELAEQLGVSRQPVSHALHLLRRQNLVVESGRKGFAVAPLDGARIRQIYEVRAALDGLAARLAAGRVGAEGRAALEGALAAGDAISEDAPLAELIALDAAFHRTIYRLSGNAAIEETAAPQWPHVRRAMAAVLMDGPYRARAWAEHHAIVDRLLAGDAEGASAAAEAHALRAGRAIEQRLGPTQEAA
ncbi:GntR family transcriptional regulator [Hansschlegelia zhihuaiae]|uniref:GntR family transcriptional regulator n=1 Tax=Hansschlegelia zhihuaiae TaxID=405005 RepID=A0A4Q0MQE6_9HYPH|nr:GntR family transcriptional regulator [Hansschlegelia zhihuaiae]RXF75346.1 GntR family transcriptional regulator [Hansschlegelia zhihuaiae]